MYLEFYTPFDNLHVDLSTFRLKLPGYFLLYSNSESLALHRFIEKVKERQ